NEEQITQTPASGMFSGGSEGLQLSSMGLRKNGQRGSANYIWAARVCIPMCFFGLLMFRDL
ncbi:MAG: hypothetical protein JWR35_3900, partial [Marmoricola sp.]|nr:hypothetical protein [Marmoricola sp.]